MKSALAYIPVLHEGYRAFIERNAQASVLYIVGRSLTQGFKPIEKEIRALAPELVAAAVFSWGICGRVMVIEEHTIGELAELPPQSRLVVADEDITRLTVAHYLSGVDVVYDPVFLRWDRHRTLGVSQPTPGETVSLKEFDRRMVQVAADEAERSSDWWRHVGAVLVVDGEVVLQGHNRHVPSQHTPYADGDPRNNFSRGENLELSTSEHAEASIIAEAARRGIALKGASLYATTFPCPPCAKLIVHAGIKRLFYSTGYARLDGESLLRQYGVEVVRVEFENPPTS